MGAQRDVNVKKLHDEIAAKHFDIDGTIKPATAADFALLENQLTGAKTKLIWRGETLTFYLVVILPGGKIAHPEVVVMDGRVLERDPNANIHIQMPMPAVSAGTETVVKALLKVGWYYAGYINTGASRQYELMRNSTIKAGHALAFHWV